MNRVTLVALLALAALSAACTRTPVRAMPPSPIVMQDERLDFARTVVPEKRTTEVSVLFATTREQAPPDAPERFTRRPGDAVRIGVARVQLGKPEWSFQELAESDRTSRPDAPRPARVVAVEEFGILGPPGGEAEREFIAAVDQQVETSASGSVLFFVPGYRSTFDEMLTLMGSWGHFLGHQPVVAFSWPTGTWAWDYLTDCPRARAFVPDIARMIALIAEHTRARRINAMAFSCGGPLLAEALVQLRQAHPNDDAEALQKRYRIANTIFAAADIDLQTFTRSHVPALTDIAQHTVVYVSENDSALRWAAFFSRASRLGRPRLDELTREDLQALQSNERLIGIDVTNVYGPHELTGARGHGYWVANQRVSSDVLLAMVYPFDPVWRGLVHPPGVGLWTFPDDYPQRVGGSIYQDMPELHREEKYGGSPRGQLPAPNQICCLRN
ncbi:MAG TPA: alpha/beta hydrolase [Povalibacter sp.]|nr:alpha/beta hydrolase [Povalibacter sp.]